MGEECDCHCYHDALHEEFHEAVVMEHLYEMNGDDLDDHVTSLSDDCFDGVHDKVSVFQTENC